MEWIKVIEDAIGYIEEHITDDLTAEDVAKEVFISPFYFQKGFTMLCGYSPAEYIRKRKLALAGMEILTTDAKVIDIALKYGYDSPDAFTKAFIRFHGVSPRTVRKERLMIKTFAPLKINISLKGGYIMDYKIEKKESFTVFGSMRKFDYEDCKEKIPMFWQEHYMSGNGRYVCGMYGVNMDKQMSGKDFEYMIADGCAPDAEIPKGFEKLTVPSFEWAIFPCDGPMPKAFQNVHKKIFSEWLPAIKEYEFAAGYCIEMYDDPSKYENGTLDEKYHSEIWIPVKKIEK